MHSDRDEGLRCIKVAVVESSLGKDENGDKFK